jgi:hypothetical protein
VFECIYWHCNWISPSLSHCNGFAMLTHLHFFFHSLQWLRTLPNMPYYYILFFQFPLIHSNFHTIYHYCSHLYITPHSTFHILCRHWLRGASRTSRSSENNRFPYVFHWLVVSCEFHSIFFAKFVQQIWTSSLHDIFT